MHRWDGKKQGEERADAAATPVSRAAVHDLSGTKGLVGNGEVLADGSEAELDSSVGEESALLGGFPATQAPLLCPVQLLAYQGVYQGVYQGASWEVYQKVHLGVYQGVYLGLSQWVYWVVHRGLYWGRHTLGAFHIRSAGGGG